MHNLQLQLDQLVNDRCCTSEFSPVGQVSEKQLLTLMT
jgi:hypothetical protein